MTKKSEILWNERRVTDFDKWKKALKETKNS